MSAALSYAVTILECLETRSFISPVVVMTEKRTTF